MDTKKRGRKTISKTERTVTVSFKAAESQRTKFLRLGGSDWVRARIDRAKIKGGE